MDLVKKKREWNQCLSFRLNFIRIRKIKRETVSGISFNFLSLNKSPTKKKKHTHTQTHIKWPLKIHEKKRDSSSSSSSLLS